jgi:hypothetical protein
MLSDTERVDAQRRRSLTPLVTSHVMLSMKQVGRRRRRKSERMSALPLSNKEVAQRQRRAREQESPVHLNGWSPFPLAFRSPLQYLFTCFRPNDKRFAERTTIALMLPNGFH